MSQTVLVLVALSARDTWSVFSGSARRLLRLHGHRKRATVTRFVRFGDGSFQHVNHDKGMIELNMI